MTQTWEYKVIEHPNPRALEKQLADAGADGWELITATASFNIWMTRVMYVLWLKRSLPAPR